MRVNKKKKDFWEKWGRVTSIESKAIDATKEIRKIILSKIPKDEIVAIYVKGSFARREMTPQSDLDIITVVNHSKYLNKLKRIESEETGKIPSREIRGYSLWELKTGKKSKNFVSKTPSVVFVLHLPHFKLIYGDDISRFNLKHPNKKKYLGGRVGVMKKIIIPRYKNGEIPLKNLAKQLFWIVDAEQRSKGLEPLHSFKELAKSVTMEKSLVRHALSYRNGKNPTKKEEKDFLKGVEKYIIRLEKGISTDNVKFK